MAKSALVTKPEIITEGISAAENGDGFLEAAQRDSNVTNPGIARIREILTGYIQRNGEIRSKAASVLVNFMDTGTESFTTKELAEKAHITEKQAMKFVFFLKKTGVVTHDGEKAGKYVLYRFNTGEQPQYIKPKQETSGLTAARKADLSILNQKFQDRSFTAQEAGETLKKAKSTVNGILRVLVLSGYAERCKGDILRYRLRADRDAVYSTQTTKQYSREIYNLIEQLTAPGIGESKQRIGRVIQSRLSKGFIQKSDYDKQGYTVHMWNYDIDTAKKLGLVTMQRSGEYIINADLTPVISKG